MKYDLSLHWRICRIPYENASHTGLRILCNNSPVVGYIKGSYCRRVKEYSWKRSIQMWSRDCAVPYVRHFYSGYIIFHCDSMKYYFLLHWITIEYAVIPYENVLCTRLCNLCNMFMWLTTNSSFAAIIYRIKFNALVLFKSHKLNSPHSFHLNPPGLKFTCSWWYIIVKTFLCLRFNCIKCDYDLKFDVLE